MARTNTKKNTLSNTLAVIAILSLLVLGGLAVQANSVAIQVDEKWGAPTVSAAFDACNAQRSAALSQGQDCEQCRLLCPSSATKQPNGLYSFSYPSASIYQGSFSDMKCDEVGSKTGNYPEVKSYCNDRVRVCTRQVGDGTPLGKESVENGQIRTIELTLDQYNCETGKSLGTTIESTRYELTCKEGYTVNGKRLTYPKSALGTCEPSSAQDREAAGLTPLEARFGEVKFDPQASTREEVTIRGTLLPDVAGTYYVYAVLLDGQSFSLVKGFSGQDACKNNPRAAGAFLTLTADDTGLFELSIPAPSEPGTYTTYVGVSETCGGEDLDTEKAALEVLGEDQLKERVITTSLTEDQDAVDAYALEVEDRLAEIRALTSCTSETDLTMDGCAVAQCVDGEVYLLGEEQIANTCEATPERDTIMRVVGGEGQSRIEQVFDSDTGRGKAGITSAAVAVLSSVGAFVFRAKRRR